jgi:Flp pilus assembly protein TadD
MTAPVGPSLESLKRRQAVEVALFLVAVTVATTGAFHFFRSDLIAFRRGETALERGDFAEAGAQLSLAWTEGYQTPRIRRDLARALLETGQRDAALTHYVSALAASPKDASLIDTVAGLYQGKGQPEKALELYRRLGPPEQLPVTALARLGDIEQQAGHFPAAIAAYQLAAIRSPEDPELQIRLGMVLSWSNRRAEAIAAFQRALQLQPGHRFAQLYLARVLLWDGRFAEAVTEFRRVLPQ